MRRTDRKEKSMVTNVRIQGNSVIITEDGVDYICDDTPGITAAKILIADFYPRNDRNRVILLQAFWNEETHDMTYAPLKPEDEKDAWDAYCTIMECMDD